MLPQFPIFTIPSSLFETILPLFNHIWNWQFRIGRTGHMFTFGQTVIWSTLLGLIVYYFGDNV